ncbi:MAG: alpha/beta fold hydrolase [Solirubrobacteraceae bacterium]
MTRIKEDVQYVFIHPSWRAGWCWDRVLAVMRAWGREAYAPDGPGHGSRLAEIESVALADYPRVYGDFIRERDLDRVVLVGNSIGGLMVQLTMQEVPDRVVHGIWYMGFVLADGECLLDACPPELSEVVPGITDNRYPVPPFEDVRSRWMQDMTAEQQTADFARWQPQPLRSFTDRADLKRFFSDERIQRIPKSFINGVKDVTFGWDHRWAWDPRLSKRLSSFTYAEVPGAHCCFNCHPEELATAVIDLAEYEHRGEAYATEELWRKSSLFI